MRFCLSHALPCQLEILPDASQVSQFHSILPDSVNVPSMKPSHVNSSDRVLHFKSTCVIGWLISAETDNTIWDKKLKTVFACLVRSVILPISSRKILKSTFNAIQYLTLTCNQSRVQGVKCSLHHLILSS